jgi:hypothetical protein
MKQKKQLFRVWLYTIYGPQGEVIISKRGTSAGVRKNIFGRWVPCTLRDDLNDAREWYANMHGVEPECCVIQFVEEYWSVTSRNEQVQPAKLEVVSCKA